MFGSSHTSDRRRQVGLGHVVVRLASGTFKLAAVAGAAALIYPPTRKQIGLMLHRKIESSLGAAIGADVRIGQVRLSPLSGEFEARSVTLRRTAAAEPFLSIQRVRGLLSLRALLRRDIELTAMEIDRPTIAIVRRRGGSVTNLPPGLEVGPVQLAHKVEDALDTAQRMARVADRTGLRLRLTKAFLVEGQVRLRDESLGGYEVIADGIHGRVDRSRDGAGYEFSGVLPHLTRVDQPAQTGGFRAQGQLRNTDDLFCFPAARLQVELWAEGPEQIAVHIDCPTIASRRVTVRLEGATELAQLGQFVPPGVPALDPLRAMGTRGRVAFGATVTYDPANGLRIPELNESARNVAVGGTSMAT